MHQMWPNSQKRKKKYGNSKRFGSIPGAQKRMLVLSGGRRTEKRNLNPGGGRASGLTLEQASKPRFIHVYKVYRNPRESKGAAYAPQREQGHLSSLSSGTRPTWKLVASGKRPRQQCCRGLVVPGITQSHPGSAEVPLAMLGGTTRCWKLNPGWTQARPVP